MDFISLEVQVADVMLCCMHTQTLDVSCGYSDIQRFPNSCFIPSGPRSQYESLRLLLKTAAFHVYFQITAILVELTTEGNIKAFS